MECKIRFDINATIEQKIILTDKHYSEDDLINGLKSGNIITTIWHGQGNGLNPYELEVLDIIKDKKIGYIKSQSATEYSEYNEYELI